MSRAFDGCVQTWLSFGKLRRDFFRSRPGYTEHEGLTNDLGGARVVLLHERRHGGPHVAIDPRPWEDHVWLAHKMHHIAIVRLREGREADVAVQR